MPRAAKKSPCPRISPATLAAFEAVYPGESSIFRAMKHGDRANWDRAREAVAAAVRAGKTGRELARVAFAAAHPKTDLVFERLDLANLEIWVVFSGAVAAGMKVKPKAAAVPRKKAA